MLLALFSYFYASPSLQRHISKPFRAQRQISPSDCYIVSVNFHEIFQVLFILAVPGFLLLQYIFYAMAVRYVTFDTRLNLFKASTPPISSSSMLWILPGYIILVENPVECNIALIIHIFHDVSLYPNWATLRLGNTLFPYVIYLNISLTAITPESHLLSLVATFAFCLRISRTVPPLGPLAPHSFIQRH